jgi:flagellar biosynthesis/type III secretory pathway protein FliH
VEAFAFEQLSGGVVEASTAPSVAARAAAIVEAAEAEAAQIRAAAHDAGFAEGRAAGLEAAALEIEAARATLASAVEGVRGTLAGAVEEAEHVAVDLALALADKILATALELRPALVRDVAAGALRGLVERELVLEVHPDDVELLDGAVEGVEVVAERRVPRGGCVVRTHEGEIDARIGQQLERAAEALREAL